VLVRGQNGDKTTTENGLLKSRLFDVKPDATAKRPLFERPAKHLLTGERQAMGVPDHEDATANVLTTGGEGHPLGEPFGKIVHSIQDGGVDGFKVRVVSILTGIRGPKSLRLSIIESFVENSMGWRKGLHG
jgi:hypothetical protein